MKYILRNFYKTNQFRDNWGMRKKFQKAKNKSDCIVDGTTYINLK